MSEVSSTEKILREQEKRRKEDQRDNEAMYRGSSQYGTKDRKV